MHAITRSTAKQGRGIKERAFEEREAVIYTAGQQPTVRKTANITGETGKMGVLKPRA